MDHENPQTKSNHELAIALMGKDIEYIKKGMESVTLTLATMDRDFARRSEMAAFGETLKKINDSLEKRATHEDIKIINQALDKKVNNSEFEPIQKTLSRINWILISTVVAGLLALLYNAGSN
jgi:hypothetical protein